MPPKPLLNLLILALVCRTLAFSDLCMIPCHAAIPSGCGCFSEVCRVPAHWTIQERLGSGARVPAHAFRRTHSGARVPTRPIAVSGAWSGLDREKRCLISLRPAALGVERWPLVQNACDLELVELVQTALVLVLQGEVDIEGLRFAYPARPDVTVFEELSLHIPASQTVALVGASGSGKSTVIQLLQRFYDPAAGTISVDGINIRSLSLEWYRNNVRPHLCRFPNPLPSACPRDVV